MVFHFNVIPTCVLLKCSVRGLTSAFSCGVVHVHVHDVSKVQYCTHAGARSAATARQVEIAHVNATWYDIVGTGLAPISANVRKWVRTNGDAKL